MAESLARIYGTEEDKVNCPFYFKIGACRHGDRCSRQHNRPHFSQTLIIPHFYQPPPVHPQTGQPLVNEKEHLTEFCEEVIDELQNFGLLEEFHIVANLGEHMLGNVYLKYSSEEEAERALKALHGRFYSGRQLTVEFSPVSDFRESRCRQYDEETCNRGAFCNFHHMRPLPSSIRKELERIRSRGHRRRRDRSRSRDRDRSDRDRYRSDRDRDRDRDRERERERGRDGDRDRERERDRDRDRRRDDRDRSSATPSTVEESRSSDRSASEERRAKIAEWNRQRDERNRAPNSSESGHRENSHSTDRSASEERRAKIAEWNKQRDAKKAEETETTTSSQQAPTS